MKQAKLLFLLSPMNGTFTGTWQLRYWNPEGEGSTKRNCLQLEAKYDEERNYMAYSYVATFDYADETTLRFQGYYAKDEDGWVNFQRGDAEPSYTATPVRITSR